MVKATERFAALVPVIDGIESDSPEVQRLLTEAADRAGAVLVGDWRYIGIRDYPITVDGEEAGSIPSWQFECDAERT